MPMPNCSQNTQTMTSTISWHICRLCASFLLCASLCLSQGVDRNMLHQPPADSWPSYHGDYTGRRHSSLMQIQPANVAGVGLAWAFQTGQVQMIKSSPLLVDGILYFTVPDNIWAVDARSGHEVWHSTNP